MFICGSFSGCTAKDITTVGQRAALESIDLVKMTDDMAMQIAGDPEVLAEYNARGSLKVVVQPVVNRLTGEVIPRGQAEAFTARVRQLLSKQARGQFTWIMNRESFYRLRTRELEGIDLGPAPDAMAPRFTLTATFSSLADEDARRRSSYYLCLYELTDLHDRTVLWSGRYEVKKIAMKGDFD